MLCNLLCKIIAAQQVLQICLWRARRCIQLAGLSGLQLGGGCRVLSCDKAMLALFHQAGHLRWIAPGFKQSNDLLSRSPSPCGKQTLSASQAPLLTTAGWKTFRVGRTGGWLSKSQTATWNHSSFLHGELETKGDAKLELPA